MDDGWDPFVPIIYSSTSLLLVAMAVAIALLKSQPLFVTSYSPALSIMRYRVHAVDIYGISHAAYELDCATDEEAEHIAASYLPRHPVIEIWQGVRHVARLIRDGEALAPKQP